MSTPSGGGGGGKFKTIKICGPVQSGLKHDSSKATKHEVTEKDKNMCCFHDQLNLSCCFQWNSVTLIENLRRTWPEWRCFKYFQFLWPDHNLRRPSYFVALKSSHLWSVNLFVGLGGSSNHTALFATDQYKYKEKRRKNEPGFEETGLKLFSNNSGPIWTLLKTVFRTFLLEILGKRFVSW